LRPSCAICGEEKPAYTFAELQALSKEEVDADWHRVQRSFAVLNGQDASTAATGDTTRHASTSDAGELAGTSRMSRAYASARAPGDTSKSEAGS